MTNPEPIASKVITFSPRLATDPASPHLIGFDSSGFFSRGVFFSPHHVDPVEVPDWLPVLLLSVSAAQSKALFNSAYFPLFSPLRSMPLQIFLGRQDSQQMIYCVDTAELFWI